MICVVPWNSSALLSPTFAENSDQLESEFSLQAVTTDDAKSNDQTRSLDILIRAAQNGDRAATEAILEQFRPLLRSRMQRVWTSLRETLTTLEWGDVEAQLILIFLTRLQAFDPNLGVYFPHYMDRMLDVDGRAWIRSQRRGHAVPFSQISTANDEETDIEDFLQRAEVHDQSRDIEASMGLRAALDDLPDVQREVVWLCCVLGKTETDAAAQLGISRGAVHNRLQSALKRMREYFGSKEEGTRTGRLRPESSTTQTPFEAFYNFILDMAKDEKRPDLVGVGSGKPVLLQGTFDFPNTGLKTPELLSPKLTYTVPVGCVAGIRYVRVGIVCEKMAVLYTFVNGMQHRIIPVAANSTALVSLSIVEAIVAGSQIEIHIASQDSGIAVIDVGILQMPA